MIFHEELGKKVAREQDRLISIEDREERDFFDAKARLFSPSAVELREQVSSNKVWVYSSAAALAIAALVAIVIAVGWSEILSGGSESEEEIALLPGTWYSSTDSASKPLRFADGSEIVLGQSSGMRIIDTSKKKTRVLLEYGEAKVDVVHREDSDWLVEVGPFAIHVVGTRFCVVWNPKDKEFNLKMEEGAIELDGPVVGKKRKIMAGETVRIWLGQERMELVAGGETAIIPAEAEPLQENLPVSDKTTETEAVVLPPLSNTEKIETEKTTQKNQTWQELAGEGRFSDIYQEAQEIGLEKVLVEASAPELMVLGDTARLLGKWSSADKTYHAIRRRFPGSPLASTSAFALGKMAFDRQHLYEKASKWLGVYLAEQNKGPLVQEALGRLMEARKLNGDMNGAKATAKRYLAKYPNGPYASKANELITPINGSESSE